ncbi:MAG: hypothetical protein ABWY12_16435 [Burkholderiales bacterium]
MSQRDGLRLAGATAFAGGTLTFIGNLFHPREPGQLDSAANLFDVVVRHGTWTADHLLIAIGLALMLNGLSGLAHSIHGQPGATWARFAWHMAVLGTLFGLALMLTEAVAVTSLAHAWNSSAGGDKDLLLAAGNAVFELSLTFSVGGMLFLFGAAPVLYGVAMLRSNEYGAWTGWTGVVFGVIGVAAAGIQVISGDSWLAFYVMFPIASIAITLWVTYLGFQMWRMA